MFLPWATTDSTLNLDSVQTNDDGTSKLSFTKMLTVDQTKTFVEFTNKQIDELKTFDIQAVIAAKQAEVNAQVDNLTALVTPVQKKIASLSQPQS